MSLWHRDNKTIGVLVMGLFFLCAVGFSLWRTFDTDIKSTDQISLRSFYYPVHTWDGPQVYSYGQTDSQLSDDIWVHTLEVVGTDSFIVSKSYDARHLLRVVQTDKILDNGVVIESLQFIQYDSTQTPIITEAEIIHGNQFLWRDLSEGELLLSQFRYTDPMDASIENTLTRNKYIDAFRIADSSGQASELQLMTKELLESKQVGSLDIEYIGSEIYTQHKGKTYYRKEISGHKLEYTLKSIQSLEAFEAENGKLIDPVVTGYGSS